MKKQLDNSISSLAPIEGERRQATVLFADISGFTSMSEKMDPEEVSVIVNDCLSRMSSIVERNEGVVDKFIGDCVMAVFGIPKAIENAPRKAINAAIEINNMIEEFNLPLNLENPVGIHSGINSGIVISGLVRKDNRDDFTVLGDTVNVASRLKDAAKTGQIFVGAATYDQTKEDFQFKELKPIKVKGKEGSVPAFELLSTKKIQRPRLGMERMIFSEMVGREEELDKLTLHLKKLLNGEGSIVSVIGEAGIGKSRLMAELRSKEEMDRVTLLEGRALSIGKNLSFHPLIDILKNWSGINEEDSEQSMSEKLERAIRTIHPEESQEIFPFIATLMGLNLHGRFAERIQGVDGEALDKLILQNLYALIEKGTMLKPVILVLEDLHWADMSSIEFFGSLYRLALQNRIMFINVLRPGYEETGEHIYNTINNKFPEVHTEIKLESLAEDESDLLINNLLKIKGFPAKIKSLIIQQTAGNPFFIEEVVRSFIDEGAIEVRNDTLEVTPKIDSVIIPKTINEVLMVRIDRLDEETRSLLKVASVIGRSFFHKILAKVAERTEEMDSRLHYLEEIQLIREQDRKEELEYLFKHALAQEAAYESILIKKRKELHLKTAVAIESIFSERLPEFYGMLAMHFSKGEDSEKAEEYLLKAGEEALRTSASAEAIGYYRDAMQLYQKRYGGSSDPEKIVMMQKNLATALRNKGQIVEAIGYYENVLAHYDAKIPSGSISEKLTIFSGLFHIIIAVYLPFLKWKRTPSQKDLEVMDILFQLVRNLTTTEPKRAGLVSFLLYKKQTAFDLMKTSDGPLMFIGAAILCGYLGVSFTLSRKILRFLKDKVNKKSVKDKLYYSFTTLAVDYLEGTISGHDYDKTLVEEGLKVGEVQYASYLIDIGFYMDIYQGNLKDAEEKVEKFKEIGQAFNNEWVQGYGLIKRIILLFKTRQLNQALTEADSSLAFHNRLDEKLSLYQTYSFKANTQILLEDPEEAERSLQMAEKIKLDGTIPAWDSFFYIAQFSLFLYNLEKEKSISGATYSLHEILKSGKKCLRISKKVAVNRTEIFKLMGTYYWLINKKKRALKWWRRSIDEGEKMGFKLELSRTYMEVGKRLQEDKSKYREMDGITATEYLEKARKMFEEMELEWDLTELDKLDVT